MVTVPQQITLYHAVERQAVSTLSKSKLKPWMFLLLFTLALRVILILNLDLPIHDSTRVAGIAREMVLNGNYLIPRLNGKEFLEYPPLGYLPIALFLGTSKHPSDFLAFLPIALFGTATVLLTFLIGRKLAGERVGFAAGFFLATMPGFSSLHRQCLVDPVLLFFTTLSLYGFIGCYHATERRFLFLGVFYLSMAGAFLSKGLIGAAIPAGTAALFLIVRRDFSAVRRLYLGRGILLFLLPILVWVAGVWSLEGSGVIKEVVRQSVQRFLSPTADHAKPFYYYLNPVLLNILPWTPLPFIWLWYRRKHPSSSDLFTHDLLALFALLWFLLVFVGLSLASAKRNIYLGPIYPPAALLAAAAWNSLRHKFYFLKGREIRGLIAIFLLYSGVHFFLLAPSENKSSPRPFFQALENQTKNGTVYIANSNESFQGAAVFYLGRPIPLSDDPEALLEHIENPSKQVYVISLSQADNGGIIAPHQPKGFNLLLTKKVERHWMQLYSNH